MGDRAGSGGWSEAGTARRRLLFRIALLGAIVLLLASIPFAFDGGPFPCAPDEETSLATGLHPSLLSLRHGLERYLDVPAALTAVEVRTEGYEDPGDVRGFACRAGHAWALWIGADPRGAGLSAVLTDVDSGDRWTMDAAVDRPDREADRAAAVERLAARALVSMFRATNGWEGLEYLEGASPEVVRNYLRGEALFRGSNFREAIEVFGYVVEDDPGLAWGWYRLANAQAWDLGQLFAWGSIARAMDGLESLRPPDRELVRATKEHYRMEHGFGEAFASVDAGSAEAMLQKGDAWFHLAPMRGRSPLEAVPFLERATRLDPGLTPARLHLIDAAILERDSVRAHEHYRAYDRRARGAIPWLRARYALRLVFGTDETRERAIAAIDSARARLPFSVPYLAQEYLSDPDLLPLQERLLLLDRRVGTDEPYPEDRTVRGARRLLVYNYLYRGRLEDAARMLALLGPEDAVFARLIRYSVDLWGLTWPEGTGPEAGSPDDAYDPTDPVDLFYTAARRLEDGRYGAYEAMEGDFLRLAAEDPDVALWKRALDARRRWLEGDGGTGPLREITAVVTHPDILEYFATHETMRWWRAEAAWRLGRWREAATWFASLPDNPWARCRARLAREALEEARSGAPPASAATGEARAGSGRAIAVTGESQDRRDRPRERSVEACVSTRVAPWGRPVGRKRGEAPPREDGTE